MKTGKRSKVKFKPGKFMPYFGHYANIIEIDGKFEWKVSRLKSGDQYCGSNTSYDLAIMEIEEKFGDGWTWTDEQ